MRTVPVCRCQSPVRTHLLQPVVLPAAGGKRFLEESQRKGEPILPRAAARWLNGPGLISPEQGERLLQSGHLSQGCPPLETPSFHIPTNSVFAPIQSRGQHTMACRPRLDRIWPMAYFCVACDFQMAFTFFKGCKRKNKEYVTETTYCLRRPRYSLSSLYRNTLPSPD